jgi:hypothetical protein
VIGAIVLVLSAGVYVEQAVSKLAECDNRPALQKPGLDRDVSRGSSLTDESERYLLPNVLGLDSRGARLG